MVCCSAVMFVGVSAPPCELGAITQMPPSVPTISLPLATTQRIRLRSPRPRDGARIVILIEELSVVPIEKFAKSFVALNHRVPGFRASSPRIMRSW